jgi:NAD(P)-dependent dehydrogenase (short-subunit alcohol dehydrogenase family)
VGASTQGIAADFSVPDAVDQMFGWLRATHERLDVLVNNAADLARTSFSEATVSLLDSQLQVNVRAPYLCCLQAAPIMRQTSSGVIVNISSVGGERAHWAGLPYDLTKGAINSMTRAMALELAPDGIRVNAVAPGAIRGWRTPPPDNDKVRALSARIPLGRMGTDLEVAAVVAFLASDEATYITGQILSVDGGVTAQLSPPGQPI